MDGLLIIAIVFVVWALCSLVMTFFLPALEKMGVDDEATYYAVAFAPLGLPVFLLACLYIGVYKLGKKVFKVQ